MSANPRADHGWKDKILRRERFADFAYTLARLDWGFFTTQTFKNPMPRRGVCYAMYYQWLHDVGKICEVPYGRILMALRGELGEKGGRFHFHSLVGGVATCNIMSLRSQMMRLWKIISGNADADFRLYDRSLAGADYICKCLGANAYEVNKFSLAEETTLSESVFRVVRTLGEISNRRCGKLIRQNGRVANGSGVLKFNSGLQNVNIRRCIGFPGTSSIQDTTASVFAGMV